MLAAFKAKRTPPAAAGNGEAIFELGFDASAGFLMSEVIDAVVIGAGVVGLAVARALAQSGREVIVLEKNHAIGMETSSRSSEVIHAGIYYTPGSLKAHLCLRGRDSLYQYCAAKGIDHRRY